MTVIEQIATTLGGLELPSLTRPAIGPDAPPTLELVQFDLRAYAYSAIAYVRDLINGLLALQAARNVAALDLVIRGLYEWTMQASYVDQQNREPLNSLNFAECRIIMDRVQTGNGWVKRHGDKYWRPPIEDEMPDSVRIKHLVKAYKSHQLESRGEENVEDDYGYLSEHAHPNCFCFLDVTRRSGQLLEFVGPDPERRSRGIATAALLDWSLCIYNVLGLANEREIRKKFVAMLKTIVESRDEQ